MFDERLVRVYTANNFREEAQVNIAGRSTIGTHMSEQRSITVTQMSDTKWRFYQLNDKAHGLELMLVVDTKINELDGVEADPTSDSVVSVKVVETDLWGTVEQVILTQLIAAAGWLKQPVTVFDSVKVDGKSSSVFREHGQVESVKAELVYSQITTAA